MKTVTKSALFRNEYDRLRLDFFLRFISEPTSSIVDIGSGCGVFLGKLRDRGFTNLSGIEPNEEAVKASEKFYGFRIYQSALSDPSLPQTSFDAAVLIAVVEHFTDPVESLRQIWSLLKPGGLLYINTPDLAHVVLRSGLAKYFKFVHTNYFTETSLKNAARLAGFEIVGSWTLPSVVSSSTLLAPDSFTVGELHLMVRKIEGRTSILEKEDWRKVYRTVLQRWRVDRFYAFSKRLLAFLRRRGIISKQKHRVHNLGSVQVPAEVGWLQKTDH